VAASSQSIEAVVVRVAGGLLAPHTPKRIQEKTAATVCSGCVLIAPCGASTLDAVVLMQEPF